MTSLTATRVHPSTHSIAHLAIDHVIAKVQHGRHQVAVLQIC